ncbi:MAG: transposase, partial [Actinomycetota bacterium]|nr:transposase [Actinomycetota bacterium]
MLVEASPTADHPCIRHRGRKHEPLYGIRQLLLTTWANLTERGWERLRAGLAAGDPDGEVAA